LYELKTSDDARKQHYVSAEFKKCITNRPICGVLKKLVAASVRVVKKTKWPSIIKAAYRDEKYFHVFQQQWTRRTS
jgi:hypothetical protein